MKDLTSLYLYTAIVVIPIISVVHVRLATRLRAALVELLCICSQEGEKRHVFLVVQELNYCALRPCAHLLQLLSKDTFVHYTSVCCLIGR